MFDWTVTLGNLLTVIGFAISGIAFVMMMRSDLRLLALRIDNVEETMKELAKSQYVISEQKGEIDGIRDRVNMVSRRLDEFISHSRAG